ncbi:MAG: hypothetical protein EBW87_05165, partial [Burkholderiaceae bacterium]|nr:hypothetical protein [Burkholderiaceae bacterium]
MEIKDLEQIKNTMLEGEPTPVKRKALTVSEVENAKQTALVSNQAEQQRLGNDAPIYNLRPDKYDFQLRTYADNQELRANRFGILKSFGAGLGKLATNTVGDILGGVSSVAIGIPSAIINGDANQIFDNAVSEGLN